MLCHRRALAGVSHNPVIVGHSGCSQYAILRLHQIKSVKTFFIVLQAENINVKAVVNLSKAARDIGAKVVFYSSDYVFDGKLSSPAENGSENNKTGVYGKYIIM